MTWKIDNTPLTDFGVRVMAATGLLNLATVRNEADNWLDENGVDWWQEAEEIKYNDREIALQCYLKADDYDAFRKRVVAFYAALGSPGLKTLATPWISIQNIYVQAPVGMVRKTQYVKKYQVGVFTLRLTVQGDAPYKLFNIYHSSGAPVVDVIATSNLQVTQTLQGDSYATCTVETNTPLNASMYDYILVNTNGTVDEPYYLFQKPQLQKLSTNKYVYNLRFEHGSYLLRNSNFLLNGESDFYLFADLDTIVDLVIENSQRFIDDKFRKGTIATTVKRNHKFTGENCYDVIRRLAGEYGLEYDIIFKGVEGPRYRIDIVEKIATSTGLSLEYGRGNELYQLSREAIDRNSLCTVMYAYGAAKNLKPGYRGGKQRLEFDGNPLRQNDNLYMGVERTVFFDDIFPRRTAAVTSYMHKLPPQLTAAEKEVWPEGIYRVTDATLDFDINQYLLGGLTAKVRMKTGDLAGFEFEIARYDHDINSMFLIPFKDERGAMYPNADLMIAGGDEYTLVDIDQPESYVVAAEAELLAEAQAWLDEHSTPQYPYRCVAHPAFTRRLAQKFRVGDRLTVVDADFGINSQYRISALTYNTYTERYDLTLSEHRIVPKREMMQMQLEAVNRAVEDTKKDTVESMRKEKETANELRNRLLDPVDDKLNADRNVREESIDPRHLAYDAGVPQFSLRNALVECNINGDFNKLQIGAGELIIHNWAGATEDRYTIKKIRDAGGTYDPTRIWVIQQTTFDLDSPAGYWMYAKLDLTPGSTQCTIEMYKEHREVKLETGYLKYKLGHISDQSSPRSAAMLWGNVRQHAIELQEPIITQHDHGFWVGCAIRHNEEIYVKACADNDENAQVCGIVREILNADQFRYTVDGFIPQQPGIKVWELGKEYFLSPTVPGLVMVLPDPEVWEVGQIRMSLGWGTTRGLKVEIDVGDEIDELPTVKLSGTWDREFEFCINQGTAETFIVDYWAVFPYTILELIIGVDNGTLPGSSIQINGNPVGGLGNISIGGKALVYATADNEVPETAEITLHTSGSFTGDPQVIRGKLKILRE